MSTAAPTKKTIRWLPLESNPEYVRDLGVPAPWRYADVMGLDEELLAFVPQPVHALILLFPITPKYETYVKQEKERIDKQGQTVSSNIVFYPQTIANACGTMGVLHSIANSWAHGGHLKLDDGGIMKKFLEKTVALTPAERATALEQDQSLASDAIKIAKEFVERDPENLNFSVIAATTAEEYDD
ncbi:Ubiquitin carboxyl-terminal hydrolase isozyme L3 [Podila horticola]|nr:Ubiquitin carboxyl-terminal hydrolase isozyme L3 [Podila horticola]